MALLRVFSSLLLAGIFWKIAAGAFKETRRTLWNVPTPLDSDSYSLLGYRQSIIYFVAIIIPIAVFTHNLGKPKPYKQMWEQHIANNNIHALILHLFPPGPQRVLQPLSHVRGRSTHVAWGGSSCSHGFQQANAYVLNYPSGTQGTWKKSLDLSPSLGSGGTSWDEESKFVAKAFAVSHHIGKQVYK